MATVTVISEDVRTVDATIDDGRVLVEPDRLPDALGWQLKPQGLCRDDVCVVVRDVAALHVGDRLDIGAVATTLGRDAVIDAPAGIAAMALSAESRRLALDSLQAPPFTLPDLDGVSHTLGEWRGRKKLLVVFASW